MGRDCAAITLIGLRVPVASLKVKMTYTESSYVPECGCGWNQQTLHCGQCGSKNTRKSYDVTESVYHQQIAYREMDTDARPFILSIGPYEAYYESVFNEDLSHVYFYIYKGVKHGPRSYDVKDVVFVPSISSVKAAEMKKWFVDNKVLTEDVFDRAFGIYTLIEAS